MIDQTTGVINLQLRVECSGSGNGREYSIIITATDSSQNASTATITITAPHDQGKKLEISFLLVKISIIDKLIHSSILKVLFSNNDG